MITALIGAFWLATLIGAVITHWIFVPYYREQIAERDRRIASLSVRLRRCEDAAAARTTREVAR